MAECKQEQARERGPVRIAHAFAAGQLQRLFLQPAASAEEQVQSGIHVLKPLSLQRLGEGLLALMAHGDDRVHMACEIPLVAPRRIEMAQIQLQHALLSKQDMAVFRYESAAVGSDGDEFLLTALLQPSGAQQREEARRAAEHLEQMQTPRLMSAFALRVKV